MSLAPHKVKGSRTIRRCGFVGGNMSLRRQAWRSHICASHAQYLQPFPVPCKPRWRTLQHQACLDTTRSQHDANGLTSENVSPSNWMFSFPEVDVSWCLFTAMPTSAIALTSFCVSAFGEHWDNPQLLKQTTGMYFPLHLSCHSNKGETEIV